jgi:hypothetical protein
VLTKLGVLQLVALDARFGDRLSAFKYAAGVVAVPDSEPVTSG